MSKFSDKINEMDSNVNPETGNKMRKIFALITLLLVIVVLPAIVIAIGAIVVGGGEIAAWVGPVAFFPWFVLVLVFGSLWFYFSKWTEE